MSSTSKKMIIMAIIVFTILLLIGISVYFYLTLNQTAKNKPFNMEKVEMAANLEEMVNAADTIVIGKYEGLHSTVNLARDEKDPTKASQEVYLAGKVYRFNVDEVLKGELEADDIHIVHRYSDEFNISETLGLKDTEVEQTDPTFINPSFSTTYIAFINVPEVKDFHGQSIEPFLIQVNDENQVEVKSNLEERLDLNDTIYGKKLTELKKEIKAIK